MVFLGERRLLAVIKTPVQSLREKHVQTDHGFRDLDMAGRRGHHFSRALQTGQRQNLLRNSVKE